MSTPGLFACGAGFCELTTQYCLHDVSDVVGEPDVYTCQPLPGGCGSTPSCPCVASVTCGTMCDTIHTGLTLTCAAGG
jgi:hypothetical protein